MKIKYLSTKTFVVIAAILLVVNTSYSQINNLENQKISQDSLNHIDDGFIFLQRTVDYFYNIPGFNNLDLVSLGQDSYVSYLGTNFRNHKINLNGVDLKSQLYGSWNLRDIPYAAIDGDVKYNAFNNLSIFTTPKSFPLVPETRIYYKIGDFAWNNANVMINRKISNTLSVYATGGEGSYLGRKADDDYKGSNAFLNLKYENSKWVFDLSTLFLDNNLNEFASIKRNRSDDFKVLPHSSNTKYFNLKISNKGKNYFPEISIYGWNAKEATNDSVLYGYTFDSNVKVLGSIFSKSIINTEKHNFEISNNINIEKINGSFWLDKTSIENSFKINSSYNVLKTFNINNEFSYKKLANSKIDFIEFAKIDKEFEYLSDLDFSSDFDFFTNIIYKFNNSYIEEGGINISKNVRFPSYSEIFTNLTPQLGILKNEQVFKFSGYVTTHLYNHKITFEPFYIKNVDPIRTEIVNNGTYVLPKTHNSFTISYPGLITSINKNYLDKIRINLNYTYLHEDEINIFDSKHTLKFNFLLTKLDDYFTKKLLDTTINISGYIKSRRNSLVYFPLYKQFAHTPENSQTTAGFKIHSNVKIKSMTFFHEMDFQSYENYQYVLGFPERIMFVRLGMNWNFKN